MGFALCPDEGPPRLWRFVEEGSVQSVAMSGEKIVSLLDKKQNLLLVNRPLYDQLGELNRHMVLRTHARIEYV
jgi:hypothetical protein